MNKSQIFKKASPKAEQVKVPGFKDLFNVRGLSAAQRGFMFQGLFDGGKIKDGKFFAAELVARCVVDDEGKRLFDDEDVAELGTMSSDFLDPLFEAAQRLSGLEAGATDEATKN